MSRNTTLALTAVAVLGIAALAPTSASAFGHSGGFGGGHGMSMGHTSMGHTSMGHTSMGHTSMGHTSMGHSSSFSRGPTSFRTVNHGTSFNRTTSFRNINRGPHYPHYAHDHHDHDHDHDHHHDHDHDHHHDHDHDRYHDHDHDHHCHHDHCGPRIGWWWERHHRPYWVYPAGGETVVGDTVVAPAATAYAAPVAKDNCNCLTKTYLDDGSVMFKDLCTKEAAVATPDELKAQAEGVPPAK
jgi:hypothetical protein